MLWEFSYPIKIAILIFPIIALVFAIPFLVYQYQKYGASHWWRFVTIYSFVFYMLAAYFLVILPLPKRSIVATMTSPYIDLNFGNFYKIFLNQGLKVGGLDAWLHFFSTKAFQQVFFNILLTVRFGVYLRYYFKKGWFTTSILSFCLSLFFELTQLSALYGLYPRPYRIFDVDDLFLNTLGGIAGYILTPAVVFMFPSRDSMDEDSYRHSRKIGMVRRGTAFLIDLISITGISLLVVINLFPKANILKTLMSPRKLAHILLDKPLLILIMIGIGSIILILVPTILIGYTLGKKLVGIRLVEEDGSRVSFWKLLLRYGYIGFVLSALYLSAYLVVNKPLILNNSLDGQFAAIFIVLLLGAYTFFDIVVSKVTKTPFVYERISGIINIADELESNMWESDE